MSELPEASIIAHQMNEELKGERIESAVHGYVSHRFAYCSRSGEEYETILAGKMMGKSAASRPPKMGPAYGQRAAEALEGPGLKRAIMIWSTHG